tara:strand:+ start:305 stop:508 length:204 start_codon:yes stop_codon:yes gene_type:complete
MELKNRHYVKMDDNEIKLSLKEKFSSPEYQQINYLVQLMTDMNLEKNGIYSLVERVEKLERQIKSGK